MVSNPDQIEEWILESDLLSGSRVFFDLGRSDLVFSFDGAGAILAARKVINHEAPLPPLVERLFPLMSEAFRNGPGDDSETGAEFVDEAKK